MKKIAYYITAHGYGHGTRSCDIINALHQAEPETPILVKTDLPLTFMQSRLPRTIEIISEAFDVGLIQKDAIQVDLEASIKAVESCYAHEEELIQQEIEFIKREDVDIVVSDIPAIPLAAAKRAGVPAIAVGNFGWDWIYSDFEQHDPRWKIYIEKIRAVYEQTDLLIRIPFAEPMAAFPNKIDVPLLAKPGIDQREKIAQLTKADSSKKWALLSFTALNLEQQALEQIAQLSDYEFFTVDPLEWPNTSIHCIHRNEIRFTDILASMDVIITKPGFGIVSECIANNKPILYTDRKNFLEYDILVKGIEKYCRQAFIIGEELYSGQFKNALKNIETAPPPLEQMPRGGAELAAKKILQKLRIKPNGS